MCRALIEGGRRCPGDGCPDRQERRRICQRIGRHERAAQAAAAAGRFDRVERHVEYLDRDCEAYTALTRADPPPLPPTRAGEFSAAAAANISDDDLVTALGECAADPLAVDEIMARLEERETAAQRAAEVDRERASAAQRQEEDQRASPLTDPTRRESRIITPEQACRESYDAYVLDQWMRAENECRGELLNRRGQAAGIDSTSLFEGPAHVARAYASDELVQWWGRNGRSTYREWKWHWFGRSSDRDAAQNAARQSVGEAPA